MNLVKDILDSHRMIERFIQKKGKRGRKLEIHIVTELRPQGGLFGLKACQCCSLLFSVTEDADVRLRDLQIRTHPDVCDSDESHFFQPEPALNDLAQELFDQRRDSLRAHRHTHSPSLRKLPFGFNNRVRFDGVTGLHVIVPFQPDAAFESLFDLTHIFLEAFQ